MILAALARREFAGASRRPSTWWTRIVYLAAVGVFVLLAASRSVPPVVRRAAQVGSVPYYARVSTRSLFMQFSAAQAAVLGILALVLVHAELSRERARRTLDLLLATGARPIEIVLGKIAAVWGRLLVLFLCGLAVMLALLSRGGISGQDILAVSALTGAVVALSSAFAAIGGSLACLPLTLLPAFGYYLLPFFLRGSFGSTLRYWQSWSLGLWLPVHFAEMADPFGLGWFRTYTQGSIPFSPIGWPSAFLASGIALAGSLFLFFLAGRMLSRPGVALGGWAAAVVRRYDAFIRRLNAAFARRIEFDPTARLLWTRPFLWREFRRSLFSRFDNRLRLGVATFVAWTIVAFIGTIGSVDGEQWSRYSLGALLLLSGLVSGLAAVYSLAGDLRRGRLDILIVAPRAGLVRAKTVSSTWLVAPLVLAALAAGGEATYLGDVRWTWSLWLAGLTAGVCAFGAGVGLSSAAWLQTTGKASVALIAALGVWAALWFIPGPPRRLSLAAGVDGLFHACARHSYQFDWSERTRTLAPMAVGLAVWFLGSLAAGRIVGRRQT